MLQDVTRTIPAGGASIFDIEAEGLTCVAANLPDFKIRFDNDSEATYRVGYEYAPPGGFRKWQVRNPRAAPLDVTFTYWDGKFVDRQQISNAPQSFLPVTLDDLAGVSYIGASAVLATASNGPRIRFGNPANSGIVAVYRKLWLAATVVADIEIVASPTLATGTLQGNVRPTVSGDPNGVTEIYTGTSPSLPGTVGGFTYRVRVPADQSYPVELEAPLVISEGHHLAISGAFVGAANFLRAGAEVLELPAG